MNGFHVECMTENTPFCFAALYIYGKLCNRYPLLQGSRLVMAFFIDSTELNELRAVRKLHWVRGVTTNPLLLGNQKEPSKEVLSQIRELGFSTIFYQLVSLDTESIYAEAERARDLLENALVLKIPSTELGFEVLSKLSSEYQCCMTALFSCHQAIVAAECGAKYVAPYVSRASKNDIDGIRLIREMSLLLQSSNTEILAASLKTPKEVEQVLLAGAVHVTTGFEVLRKMQCHELSELTVRSFKESGKGLSF